MSGGWYAISYATIPSFLSFTFFSLLSIHALHLHINQLQCLLIACLFDSVQPSRTTPAHSHSTLHIRLLHTFSHLLQTHMLNMSNSQQKFPIHSTTHLISHLDSERLFLIFDSIQLSQFAPLTSPLKQPLFYTTLFTSKLTLPILLHLFHSIKSVLSLILPHFHIFLRVSHRNNYPKTWKSSQSIWSQQSSQLRPETHSSHFLPPNPQFFYLSSQLAFSLTLPNSLAKTI